MQSRYGYASVSVSVLAFTVHAQAKVVRDDNLFVHVQRERPVRKKERKKEREREREH